MKIDCKVKICYKNVFIVYIGRKLNYAQTLHTVYHCFVYPYMNYCIDVWGDTCKSYLEPLVKLQKKVLRIISYSGFNSNVDNVFKKLEIMQIKKIHVYKVALVMFKVKDLSAPAVLRDLFRENKSVHDYDTRQRGNFHVPQANRNYLRQSISCKGDSIWNRVIQYVTFDCSFLSFKYALRKHVLSDESILNET